MHGNVSEWCRDVYHRSYLKAPADGSAWTQGGSADAEPTVQTKFNFTSPWTGGPDRVLRGGSWIHRAPSLRSAHRDRHQPGSAFYYIGLRLVLAVGTP